MDNSLLAVRDINHKYIVVEKKIPSNWDQMELSARRMFLSVGSRGEAELISRDKVCAMEILTECFGGNPGFLKRTDSIEINNILMSLKGWKRNKTAKRYGPHGLQRGFERI
jgi:hypothetical protein